jgi:hypothetical protein
MPVAMNTHCHSAKPNSPSKSREGPPSRAYAMLPKALPSVSSPTA